jgi:hypothetical protein
MGKRKRKEAVEASSAVAPATGPTAESEASATLTTNVATATKEVGHHAAPQATPHEGVATTDNEPRVDFNKPIPIAANHVAGVELRKFDRFKQMQLQFQNAVPENIQQLLKQNGWTHRPAEGVYTKQYGDSGPGTAYVEARRLFQQLCKQLAPGQDRGVSF